ncbi:MAG: ATP-binding protein [Pyrinomonadaceae bacterium]
MAEHADRQIDLSVEPPVRRRSAPWLLGGLVLVLLFVLVALQVFGLWEVVTPDTATDTLTLYALSSLNFVAFIVFAFIFVRNLLKLRRERRARILGSKIKTRLVVYFITVSLLPIAAMAVFSYLFFNRTLEKMFGRVPEDVVSEARLARDEDLAQQAENMHETARMAALAFAQQRASSDQAAPPELDRLLTDGNFAALALGVPNGNGGDELRFRDGVDFKRSKELADALKTAFWRLQNGAQDRIPLTTAEGIVADALSLGDGRALLVARETRADSHLNKIVSGADRFEELRKQQRKVRLLGLSTLGLLTLLLLFAATWAAIHLARGIGTPIRALAEAADEVARGNLAHRVTALAEDELALLAGSFNQMTAQLEENRRRIEAGAGELREKNLALAERRNYIETVLESLSTGVISLDEQNRVTTINAAALSMLRLASAPAPGTSLDEIATTEDCAVLERVLQRARRAGRGAWQMELARGANADTAGLPVALTATALGAPAHHAARGVVLVLEDLSELLAAQRAAAWSEVARRMAHEIKNPLTPIQLSAERIARHFRRAGNGQTEGNGAGNGYEQQRPVQANGHGAASAEQSAEHERVARVVEECTATITREVAGLKAMVDEFSRFARLPHARLEAADLNEVVRQAVALYEDRLEGVRLDVRLAHTLPPAMLDAEQMRRVLVNLIDNALEALSEQDASDQRITVATAHDPARSLLLVEVVDTGHGIARADYTRLFQPYFSTRGRGTGLGLAIVQRIITEHGGRIRAEANRPRGAQFILELPVTEETTNKMSDARY